MSSNVVRIINQAEAFKEKPSSIIGLEDEFLAFCFNEACLYILGMLRETDDKGNKKNIPMFSDSKENNKETFNELVKMQEERGSS